MDMRNTHFLLAALLAFAGRATAQPGAATLRLADALAEADARAFANRQAAAAADADRKSVV